MKAQLTLSLSRTLMLDAKNIRYQIGYFLSNNLLDLFNHMKKDAFIGKYGEYRVLFVKTPRYFKGYRAKYFRFNVLQGKEVIYKTDDIIQLIDYLG